MEKVKRVIVVGGVAGGASTVARLRRLNEQAQILLLEKGPHISFANCGLPYYIGGDIQERSKLLVMTPESLSKRFNVDIRTNSEVLSIDRTSKKLCIKNLASGEEYEEVYDKLVLSPGAKPFVPPIEGLDSVRTYTLRNLEDTDKIYEALESVNPKHCTVVGGGFIGLEVAEAMVHRGIKCTVVELMPQVMPPMDSDMVAFIHQELIKNGVDLQLGKSLKAVEPLEGNSVKLFLSDSSQIETEFVVLSVGVRGEVALATESGIELGATRAIKTNEHMQTSDPDVYAIGDAIEQMDIVSGGPTVLPLAGPANRQGRIVADHICGKDSAYKGCQGTAIVKVFNVAAGSTGMSEKRLKALKIPYKKVHVHSKSHAGYYPGAKSIAMKLLFDPNNGRILGLQAVGEDGVDKRVDVVAVAIRAGMTVYDLEHLELCYAPPYGSAKDPVNIAGFAASNLLRGDLELITYEELMEEGTQNKVILDVRNATELEGGRVMQAVHIPLGELRSRMEELPRDKEIIPYCAVGMRGYLAYRQLVQAGFKARSLAGGFTTYQVLSEFLSPN